MADNIISVRNLCFSYTEEDAAKEHPVLKNLNIDIERGSFVSILGHNGSGKSTFAKLLNMILTPTSGKIYIDGRDITDPDMTEDDVFDIRRRVGMVFQNPDNQLVATIVEEDVAFGPENLGIPPDEIRKRLDDALDTVGVTHLISCPAGRSREWQLQGSLPCFRSALFSMNRPQCLTREAEPRSWTRSPH